MSDFLYPFLSGERRDDQALVDDLIDSAAAKMRESVALRARTLETARLGLDDAAEAVAGRVSQGGRVLVFGNGGSSTDADCIARLFSQSAKHRIPARTLHSDPAILTALGNDVGFDLVFSRQIESVGRGDDVAIGLSTSGNSQNLVNAFEAARRRGMLTIGFSGADGGVMAAPGLVDHLFLVESVSIHRIQETHAALAHALRERTSERLEHAAHA